MSFLKKNFNFIVIGLAVLAFIMMFLDGVKVEMKSGSITISDKLEGIKAVFGDSDDNLKFNFLSFIGYLLPLGAAAVAWFVKNKYVKFIVAGMFLLAAIFMFLEVTFFLGANDANAYKEYYKLATGPILGAIFSIIGAVLAGFVGYTELKK